MYQAVRCGCGRLACLDWHVSGVADAQGVKFTEAQAVAVAQLLSEMEATHASQLRRVDAGAVPDAGQRGQVLRLKELGYTNSEAAMLMGVTPNVVAGIVWRAKNPGKRRAG